MPPKISSPEQVKVVMSKNKLRQYPGAKKGRSRLLPYARPNMVTDVKIADDATFFVIGNCFARSIEKSLKKANRPVLSSPSDLNLPGSATEQYQRYNIFNLDVSTNEVAWAIDPDSQTIDDALIEVGGEWVDMQIHWAFAHDEDTAKRYRAIYNQSYSGLKDADVIIVSLSGVEQWYDNECGIYLNIMPTPKMVTQEPGRYDFHRLDVEACANSLRRFCDLVIKHCKPEVQILVTVSPVSQPAVHSANDALVDQFLAKSIQRTAADIVCAEYEQLEYLPALEAAMLSDFRFGFRENSMNHSSQGLADRVVAEMLDKYQDANDGQKILFATGHAEALFDAGDFVSSVAQIELLLEAGIATTSELDELYIKGLSYLKRQPEAVSFIVEQIKSGRAEDSTRAFDRIKNIAKVHANDQELADLILFAENAQLDAIVLKDAQAKRAMGLISSGPKSSDIKDLQLAVQEGRLNDAIELAKVQLELDADLSPLDLQRVVAGYVQALLQSGQQYRAAEVLLTQIERSKEPSPKWKTQIINLARTHADLPMLDQIWGMTQTFTQSELDRTIRRKVRLSEQEQVKNA